MGSILIATCVLGISAGSAHATPAQGLEDPVQHQSMAEPGQPGLAQQAEQKTPLPRFTVGWYCPPPDTDPLRQLIGFGLGVALIWGVSERRKAREARRAQRA